MLRQDNLETEYYYSIKVDDDDKQSTIFVQLSTQVLLKTSTPPYDAKQISHFTLLANSNTDTYDTLCCKSYFISWYFSINFLKIKLRVIQGNVSYLSNNWYFSVNSPISLDWSVQRNIILISLCNVRLCLVGVEPRTSGLSLYCNVLTTTPRKFSYFGTAIFL